MMCVNGLIPDDMLKKAKGYALRLFKLRPRSEAELRVKLGQKGFLADIVSKIVEDYISRGYIDDRAFAKCWMQSRLKKYGYIRVVRELFIKGISKEIVASLWQDAREDHDEESVVRLLVDRRIKLYKAIEPLKRKKRITDYLLRRGFSTGVINKVIKDL